MTSDSAEAKAAAADRWRWVAGIIADVKSAANPSGGLTEAQCRVALVVFSYINRASGKAWPSVARVAAEAGTDRRTVSRAFRALQDRGWLVLRRAGGGRTAPQKRGGTDPLHGATNIFEPGWERLPLVEAARDQRVLAALQADRTRRVAEQSKGGASASHDDGAKGGASATLGRKSWEARQSARVAPAPPLRGAPVPPEPVYVESPETEAVETAPQGPRGRAHEEPDWDGVELNAWWESPAKALLGLWPWDDVKASDFAGMVDRLEAWSARPGSSRERVAELIEADRQAAARAGQDFDPAPTIARLDRGAA